MRLKSTARLQILVSIHSWQVVGRLVRWLGRSIQLQLGVLQDRFGISRDFEIFGKFTKLENLEEFVYLYTWPISALH